MLLQEVTLLSGDSPGDLKPRTMFVGDTGPTWRATVVYRDTLQPVDLTDWALTLVRLKEIDTGTVVAGGGSLDFVARDCGEIEYEWGASDTATAGRYDLVVQMTDADSDVVTLKEERELLVEALPTP